jgi:hypothetical protein
MACVRDCAAQKRVCTCPRDGQRGTQKPGQPDAKKPDQDYVPKERK